MNTNHKIQQRPKAVITGASSGLGKSYAQQLAAQGNDLLIVARRESLLQELKTELEKKYHINVDCMAIDLADAAQLQQLVNTIEILPRLDYMINNAGFGLRNRFPNVIIDDEIKMIRVHCEANVRLCLAALKTMCRQKSGNIINVCSLAAYLTGPGAAQYCATKAFLNSFSQSLQFDVEQDGIRIQSLCPGFVHTGFHEAETMRGYDMSVYPKFTWLNCDWVVRDSLKVIRRKRHKVVHIPSLRYKLMYAATHIPIISPLFAMYVRKMFKR